MNSTSKTVRYKCPFCEKRMTREELVIHVGDNHDDMMPEGFTPFRFIFHYVNKKSLEYHGKCTECGGPTPWDENKGRYNRQCEKPACKASFIKKFEENMMRTKGVTRITSTPEGQEQMLAKRKISGTYKFQNGVEKTYTGSYELKALQFMDKVMNINPDDILCPGPIIEYMYDSKKHFYISDIYYQPYNLIIEVKDGGKRPNKRDMPEYRAKQVAKERHIIKNTNYNYLRLTDNDLSQLLSVFADLKMQMVENTGERVIHINESANIFPSGYFDKYKEYGERRLKEIQDEEKQKSIDEAMNALMSGYIPGIQDAPDSVYIVNYMKNNVFSGEQEKGYGISDNCKLTNLICRNKEGILCKAPENFLFDCHYDVYNVPVAPSIISQKMAPYMDKFVSEGFIYETVFGKKMYSYDQIMIEENAFPVIDYYQGLEFLKEAVRNYITGKSKEREFSIRTENSIIGIDIGNDGPCMTYMCIRDNKYRVESVDFPEISLESTTPLDKNSLEYKFLEGLSFRKE